MRAEDHLSVEVLAAGGRTYKLKFGHHGGNQSVRDETTGIVQITAQNHNYAVDPDSLDPNQVEITHWNLNDGTVDAVKNALLKDERTITHDPLFIHI